MVVKARHAPIVIPQISLHKEDNEPLETPWHRAEIGLLIESLLYHWRDRTDFYAGGNMFVYYSIDQARHRNYRGPDFYVVLDVDGTRDRDAWVVWEEDGRYPDVIVELLSPTTADTDKTTKKRLYERTFHTGDYFCYDPATGEFLGWQLSQTGYVNLQPNEHGCLWSQKLGLWLGPWDGEYLQTQATWLRFFDPDGRLVLIEGEAERERAEAERERANIERARAVRAEAERQIEADRRAEAERRALDAEQELARLRNRLRELGIEPNESGG